MNRMHARRFLTVGTVFLIAVLSTRATHASFEHSELPERDTLLKLFKETQDVLLTINSEILRYSERLDTISSRVLDRRSWDGEDIEQKRFLPVLKDLNRITRAMDLIQTGLDSKYGRIKGFQAELASRYPSLVQDIDHYYNMFDKIFDDCMARQSHVERRVESLRGWFREKLSAKVQQKMKSLDPAPPTVYRPARGRRVEDGPTYEADQKDLQVEAMRRAKDREILGQLETLLAESGR